MWRFGSSAVASPDFSPPIVLTQVYLGFIRSKTLIPELGKPFVLPVAECLHLLDFSGCSEAGFLREEEESHDPPCQLSSVDFSVLRVRQEISFVGGTTWSLLMFWLLSLIWFGFHSTCSLAPVTPPPPADRFRTRWWRIVFPFLLVQCECAALKVRVLKAGSQVRPCLLRGHDLPAVVREVLHPGQSGRGGF